MSDPKRTARAIVDRFLAGETVPVLAWIYGISWPDIEAIIRRALKAKRRKP